MPEYDLLGGVEAAGDGVIAGAADEVGDVGETVVEGGEDEEHVVGDVLGSAEALDDALGGGDNPIFALRRRRRRGGGGHF